MGEPPSSPDPPPPSRRWFWLGALAGALAVVLGVLLAVGAGPGAAVNDTILWVIIGGPPVLGFALVVGRSPRSRYLFGCGVLIGWPLGFIASSGICVGAGLTMPFDVAG